jgi:hypothetical protein
VGRREEVRSHEQQCECIPRSRLREQVLQLDGTHFTRTCDMLHQIAHLEAQIVGTQRSGDEGLKAALQCIHGFAQVSVHYRDELQNGIEKDLWHTMAFAHDPHTPLQYENDVVGKLVIKESNYNVSALFRNLAPQRGVDSDLVVCLGPHPQEWSFCLIDPTNRQHKLVGTTAHALLALDHDTLGGGHPNLMSSDEFEKKYVVDGKFYIGVRCVCVCVFCVYHPRHISHSSQGGSSDSGASKWPPLGGSSSVCRWCWLVLMFQLLVHVLWRSSVHLTWWRRLGLTGNGHFVKDVDVQRAASNQRALLLSHYRCILQKNRFCLSRIAFSYFINERREQHNKKLAKKSKMRH